MMDPSRVVDYLYRPTLLFKDCENTTTLFMAICYRLRNTLKLYLNGKPPRLSDQKPCPLAPVIGNPKLTPVSQDKAFQIISEEHVILHETFSFCKPILDI